MFVVEWIVIRLHRKLTHNCLFYDFSFICIKILTLHGGKGIYGNKIPFECFYLDFLFVCHH